MKIIYCTTSMIHKDFYELTKNPSSSPNPSNQNFHNKLIQGLALYNDVSVISLRPINKNNYQGLIAPYEVKNDENITYHYLKTSSNKFLRPLVSLCSFKKVLIKLLKENPNSLILVDSLNYVLSHFGQKIGKKFNTPVVGIVSDNITNISGISDNAILRYKDTIHEFDGYLALTDTLEYEANLNNKPTYVFAGLVENNMEPFDRGQNHIPYFFFGGALYERYGSRTIVEAFKKVNPEYELWIAGHGKDVSYIEYEAKLNDKIKFLGLLNSEDIVKVESQSSLNINPRFFDEYLDKRSVPSKVLEYLSVGVPILSVRSSVLQDEFIDEIFWCDDGDVDSLANGINRFLNASSKERIEMARRGQEKVVAQYSVKVQGKKISHFLQEAFNSSSID